MTTISRVLVADPAFRELMTVSARENLLAQKQAARKPQVSARLADQRPLPGPCPAQRVNPALPPTALPLMLEELVADSESGESPGGIALCMSC